MPVPVDIRPEEKGLASPRGSRMKDLAGTCFAGAPIHGGWEQTSSVRQEISQRIGSANATDNRLLRGYMGTC